MITKKELEEIEARTNAATPEPWTSDDCLVIGPIPSYAGNEAVCLTLMDTSADSSNAIFIAHAREDVPHLIAEVRRLREALSRSLKHLKLSNELTAINAVYWAPAEAIRQNAQRIEDRDADIRFAREALGEE